MTRILSILSLSALAVLVSACASQSSTPTASRGVDDRAYNPQTSRFETKTQSAGIDAQRRNE